MVEHFLHQYFLLFNTEGVCDQDEFKCDVSRCIHISRVCDHVQDCNDHTDETCSKISFHYFMKLLI
jgi:hypothetical protein